MSGKVQSKIYTGSVLASAAFLALLAWAGASRAAPTEKARLEAQFAAVIRPFVKTNCAACHGGVRPQASLDLTAFTSLESVAQDFAHWNSVMERVESKQMPPANFGKHPTDAQRAAVTAWIRAVRDYEARRSAGDPGPVLARRLSNAEYDYTIRDLTGQDLRPTREFPVDPANLEGFDNSGESLTFSPALMKKYAQAARDIADHLALNSNGIEFAAHPVLAETDRDKYGIFRIVNFYKRQPTDLADYFEAAWRYRNRATLGTPDATLQTLAASAKISPRYLTTVWNLLDTAGEKDGPIAELQAKWNALPRPDAKNPNAARAACESLRDGTLALRKKLAWHFDNLRVPSGFSTGGQCFVLWKDRQYASHRQMLAPGNLQIGGVPQTRTVRVRRGNGQPPTEKTVTDAVDPDLFAPLDDAARAVRMASLERFCRVFPDAFYIAERGRMFVDDPGDKGRLLSAGLHNSMGYFRDDAPLMDLILDEAGQRELDRL